MPLSSIIALAIAEPPLLKAATSARAMGSISGVSAISSVPANRTEHETIPISKPRTKQELCGFRRKLALSLAFRYSPDDVDRADRNEK
jgi:hypothetical protein